MKTNIFIIPNETQHELYVRLQKKKVELNAADNGIFWFTTKKKMGFGRSPKIQILNTDINELVADLRFDRVKPIMVAKEWPTPQARVHLRF